MNLDVSLDLYKIFCTVVKTKNMSLAAKQLYISQPAVSMAVRQLESRLGSALLVRTTKGVRTTPEGKVLYEYLSQALNLIQTAEKKYSEMVNLENGEISIGASDTLISKFLLPYMERYTNTYSAIGIKVTNRTTNETIKLLKNGQVDIGFVNLPLENEDGLEVTQCLTVQDCLIGGTKYMELAQKGITFEKIKNYPLLMLEKTSNSRRYIDKFTKSLGVVLNPNIELGSSELLLEFARINFGISFVVREFAQKQIDNETLFEISLNPEIPQRSIGMIKLKNVALSFAAARFIELFNRI